MRGTLRREASPLDTTCSAIVERIARREGVPPTDLEPQLYDVVDPDALEALLSTGTDGRSPVTVTFEYAGYDVVVGSDGTLVVE